MLNTVPKFKNTRGIDLVPNRIRVSHLDRNLRAERGHNLVCTLQVETEESLGIFQDSYEPHEQLIAHDNFGQTCRVVHKARSWFSSSLSRVDGNSKNSLR